MRKLLYCLMFVSTAASAMGSFYDTNGHPPQMPQLPQLPQGEQKPQEQQKQQEQQKPQQPQEIKK